MSKWTHIIGVIRIHHSGADDIDLEEKIGKVLYNDSDVKVWKEQDEYPERFTPTGSEGGIDYFIYLNPDKSDLIRYTVTIFGDLRDYCDISAVKKWFEDILYNKDLWIRDAVLNIEVEKGKKETITYKEKRGK